MTSQLSIRQCVQILFTQNHSGIAQVIRLSFFVIVFKFYSTAYVDVFSLDRIAPHSSILIFCIYRSLLLFLSCCGLWFRPLGQGSCAQLRVSYRVISSPFNAIYLYEVNDPMSRSFLFGHPQTVGHPHTFPSILIL